MSASNPLTRLVLPVRTLSPHNFLTPSAYRNTLPRQQLRHESSARRMTKKLRVQPAPSYTNTTILHDHIIYNPPSSEPNVYHTPPKFLPRHDPRHQFFAALHQHGAAAAAEPVPDSDTVARTGTPLSQRVTGLRPPDGPAPRLPAPVRPFHAKKYHLTDAQVAEMRSLRAADPAQWTRARLAARFGCSEFFAGLVCASAGIGDARKREREAVVQAAREKWGRRKREAREDRVRRRRSWGKVD